MICGDMDDLECITNEGMAHAEAAGASVPAVAPIVNVGDDWNVAEAPKRE